MQRRLEIVFFLAKISILWYNKTVLWGLTMNIAYVNHNGKILVTDDKGVLTERDYQNDIQEVLVQENVVESIDNRIDKQHDKIHKYRANKKKTWIMPLMYTGIYLVFPWITTLISTLTGGTMEYYESFLGSIPVPLGVSFVMGGAGLFVTHIFVIYDKIVKKKDYYKRESIKPTIKYLEAKKEEAKEHLNELEENANNQIVINSRIMNNKPILIYDIDRLSEIDKYITVHDLIGKNFSKIYRSYKSGKLDDLLKKMNELSNRQMYLDYIEERGPQLVKNFHKNNIYSRGN